MPLTRVPTWRLPLLTLALTICTVYEAEPLVAELEGVGTGVVLSVGDGVLLVLRLLFGLLSAAGAGFSSIVLVLVMFFLESLRYLFHA